jgi:hypothetical protein
MQIPANSSRTEELPSPTRKPLCEPDLHRRIRSSFPIRSGRQAALGEFRQGIEVKRLGIETGTQLARIIQGHGVLVARCPTPTRSVSEVNDCAVLAYASGWCGNVNNPGWVYGSSRSTGSKLPGGTRADRGGLGPQRTKHGRQAALWHPTCLGYPHHTEKASCQWHPRPQPKRRAWWPDVCTLLAQRGVSENRSPRPLPNNYAQTADWPPRI